MRDESTDDDDDDSVIFVPFCIPFFSPSDEHRKHYPPRVSWAVLIGFPSLLIDYNPLD
jgi:hypothetical protein